VPSGKWSGRGNCLLLLLRNWVAPILRHGHYAYEGDLSHTHTQAKRHSHTESNELMVIFKNPTTVRAITAQISCGIALERQCSPRSRTRTPEQRSLIADLADSRNPSAIYIYIYTNPRNSLKSVLHTQSGSCSCPLITNSISMHENIYVWDRRLLVNSPIGG